MKIHRIPWLGVLLLLAACSGSFTPTAVPYNTPTPLPPTATYTPTAIPTETPTPAPTAIPTLAAGATQVSPTGSVTMVYVPAGEFLYGSTTDDKGADPDEFPQRSINLDAFWIGQTEVTNAMYAAFLNEMGNQMEGRANWLNPFESTVRIEQVNGNWQPVPGYENYPVVGVTWYGSRAFCNWAGGDLPTEAQWEKAARGTDGRIYPWGNDVNCDNAEFYNCKGRQLKPVGSKPGGASPYGALDMAGNAWEWVQDWYEFGYYETMPAANPAGPAEGTVKVMRGGSFDYDEKHARAADRRNNGPSASPSDHSFRCVWSVEP